MATRSRIRGLLCSTSNVIKHRFYDRDVEKDVDEVLQSSTVFTNVSKGILAKDKDLQAAFGTTDQPTICLEILSKGELQVRAEQGSAGGTVAEEERRLQYDHLFKDVAGVLVDKCVNADSGRPYTQALMERALRDVHFSVDPKRSAKQQALEALKVLQGRFPIQRARMRLRLALPLEHQAALMEQLEGGEVTLEGSEVQGAATFSATVQVEPGLFRQLHAFMQSTARGKGRLEVISFAVTAEGASADEFGAQPPPATPPTPLPSSPTSPDQEASRGEARGTTGAPAAAAAGQGSGAAGPAPPCSSVLYPAGPIAGLPEAHAQRRERFAELDSLQPGWTVELRSKGDAVEAVFFKPGSGECVGAFANARRLALAASRMQG
ncbi:hypothetical protein QJQ45_004976 [Haematococcus lacustris]|nr:hypothetical protein QJQ45_004976 [Haematococcus lacustris]